MGKGIGQKLIKIAPGIARQNGYKKISLNVDQDNPRAARLYDYMGFKTTSTMTIGDRMYDHMIKKLIKTKRESITKERLILFLLLNLKKYLKITLITLLMLHTL